MFLWKEDEGEKKLHKEGGNHSNSLTSGGRVNVIQTNGFIQCPASGDVEGWVGREKDLSYMLSGALHALLK